MIQYTFNSIHISFKYPIKSLEKSRKIVSKNY